MCRLLGYAAPAPTTVETVLGGEQRQVFADMAVLHRDGWGTAWRDGGGSVRADVHANAATDDPALTDSLAAVPAPARIVHLRLATRGMATAPANTHPFLVDGMAFAHNGSLEPTGPIERLVSARHRAALAGTTDSERYFAAVRTALDTGVAPLEATLTTVAALRAAYPHRSLNALLLTPAELIAVHASQDVPIPFDEFTAVPAQQLPRYHAEGYYLMRMRRNDDGSVVFASSGLDIAGWEPLPAESVTRVDLSTLAVETVPLSSAASSMVA